MEIRSHLLAGAIQVPSPNQNARPAGEISLIVIHGISLPPGEFGGGKIAELFTNTLDTTKANLADLKDVKVSSHLLIDRKGGVTQFVGFDQRAWHAGQSAFFGRENCNDFSIGIELEGTDEMPYEDVQYQQLARICRALMNTYGIREICGHVHISPGRKTDPGSSFEWHRLKRDLAALR